ncbi:nifR3 family TIM-barrel protein [Kaistia dalseonensis]|uniref:tRNA-dihydrouridine synthase n=1 Tax=Kaistia dalseonensis TaxID=410840 RepID=A0ABU0H303_9HYPH|nr:nifR3 family TIM-barrel protein [Kaistia dalseonensis]
MAEPLAIGGVTIANRIILAPMSGVSDRPFRRIAAAHGAGMVVSEMVASEELADGNPETVMRAEATGNGLHVVQLAGREAHWMAEGARAAADAGADIIDINMGCPAKRVTTGYSGSALMRDLDHALTLIDATVAASPVPVTLKMRLGWDDNSINAPELARRAESAGIAMVTVHGRTRCQFYKGRADWSKIAAVKAAISIPLIANGDVEGPDDLDRILRLSGADGVMVGRGAYGRPWLPGHLATYCRTGAMPAQPQGEALIELAVSHYEEMIALYGPILGVRNARKHLGWMMEAMKSEGMNIDPAARLAIMTENHPARVVSLIRHHLGGAETRRAA